MARYALILAALLFALTPTAEAAEPLELVPQYAVLTQQDSGAWFILQIPAHAHITIGIFQRVAPENRTERILEPNTRNNMVSMPATSRIYRRGRIIDTVPRFANSTWEQWAGTRFALQVDGANELTYSISVDRDELRRLRANGEKALLLQIRIITLPLGSTAEPEGRAGEVLLEIDKIPEPPVFLPAPPVRPDPPLQKPVPPVKPRQPGTEIETNAGERPLRQSLIQSITKCPGTAGTAEQQNHGNQ